MPVSVGLCFLKQTFCEGQWSGVPWFEDCLLEQKREHDARMRGWLGAGCALALLCACILPREARAQGSSAGSKADAPTSKAKTADPKTHVKAAAKESRAGASAPAAKAHPASHPAAGTHPKSSTAVSAHSSKSKYAASRKNGKRKTTARGQQKIDPERAQEIQEALIREHYLSREAAGNWNQASEDAMRRYQADHGWQSKTVPDSRALISLGLGPRNEHLLNPESAMVTGPFAPRPAALTPASHNADSGARVNPTPAPPADHSPATPPHDPSSPQ